MLNSFKLVRGLFVRLYYLFVLFIVVVGYHSIAKAGVPVLLSQPHSTRAAALDAATLRREPFTRTAAFRFGQDDRTRIMLFAKNVTGASVADLVADAEDGSHRHYALTVEYVGPARGVEQFDISQVILRLSDDLGDVGDVLVQLTYRGVSGNRVRVGIGYVGDGLADDITSITGNVARPGGSPLAGVVVSLTGATTGVTITDAAGNYSFSSLVPGGTYTVAVSRVNYTFASPTLTLTDVVATQRADFRGALANYILSGRITDSGNPLSGITVALTGSQSAATLTDAGGNYSFTVPAEGDYLVMPIVLDFNLSPASFSVTNLSSNRVYNFEKTGLFYTLEFDGTPKTVDYGDFFQLQPGQTQLGKFFWEFWAMPGTNAYARYMLSDGYGGAHALLFGFVSDSTGSRYAPYGNVWNGTTAIDFGADDGPAPNEWGHLAVGWDGNYIYTYFNGVPVGLKPFSGPRMPAGSDNGGGRLFIGGSDHSNFMGRIEQVRGFENVNPRDNGLQTVPFRPDTLFGLTQGISQGPRSTFLSNFLRPALAVPDLAGGHVGRLRGTAFGPINEISSYPLPQYVIDPGAPNYSTVRGPVTPPGLVDNPAPVPDNAIIFDSFSRRSTTYAFSGHGGLGSTEGGTAGRREWQIADVPGGGTSTTNKAFGILNGQAVALSINEPGSLAWVETGSTSGYLLTRVSRHPGFYKSGIDTGLAFRVVDSSNFFFAFTYGDPVSADARKLIVGYRLDGRITFLVSNVPMPQSWNKLQVASTSAGNIAVFAEDTLVYSTTSSLLANAAGVGLFNFSNSYALANRWDYFTVYDRP